ncbi:MAG: PAS domain S-box protein, partial [bacterium]|nr:PAS domain S-box protein [bacterium]
MSKPTYAELDKRIKELEQRLSQDKTDDNEKSKYSDMYSFLSDNVSDIIWMMDMNMNTIYVNSAAERKRGFTVEELLSQGLDEKLTPESKEIALKVFDEKLTEIKDGNIPEMVTLDLEFTCKDGSTFWGESNISFKFENGKPVAIYGITRDISEYREAKKDLEKKERLYRSAIKAAEGVSYYHDVLNKNYEFIDEGIKDLTGYSRDEFSPQIWDSIIVETVFWGGYRGMTYRGAKDHAEDYGERPYWKAEYKIRKKNGEEVWLADNSVLIYDAQGKTIASLGILQDITERKMAEEALESEHNLLKTLIENLPAAISVKDLNSEIIMCNQRAVENFRKNSMDDIIGKTDYDLIDKKIAEEFHKEEQEIIRTSIPIQNKIIHSSDKKKWGSNFKIPLRNSKGEITNLLAINYDVTELKLKEIENRDLERQLFHSQKMESIGRLAGGLAHDFNNILAGIMGYGELLKIHFNNPETMEGKAAEVIYEAAIKASKLTKQLLNFSRKEKHSTAPLNVNTVIKNAVKISEKIFEEKVVVETRFCEELNIVEANESQLDQVFTNLLINANDAMPDGG